MRRIHFIEVHEENWCPAVLRSLVVDYLRVLWTFSLTRFIPSPAENLASAIAPVFSSLKVRTVLDVCSGGGGPWFWLQPELSKKLNYNLHVTLSDLHPQTQVWSSWISRCGLNDSQISFKEESVNAAHCDLKADFRTMLLSFHHMKPNIATDILRDTIQSKQGILIAELQDRCIPFLCLQFFGAIFLGVIITAVAILTTSMSMSQFCYRILWFWPAVFLFWFDGIVSTLRTYSDWELREMIESIPEHETYVWILGSVKENPGPLRYLIGYPKRKYE
jgi:hypothetical protein